MAYAFAPISAKPTFGNLRDNLYQSDYIQKKKSKHLCQCKKSCNTKIVNTGNLIMGQYSKLDLTGVCTAIPTTPCNKIDDCEPCQMKEPVPIPPTENVPFYYNNTLDPLGTLFGNSQCGEQNYARFMVFRK
jgi:hypothetical protein